MDIYSSLIAMGYYNPIKIKMTKFVKQPGQPDLTAYYLQYKKRDCFFGVAELVL